MGAHLDAEARGQRHVLREAAGVLVGVAVAAGERGERRGLALGLGRRTQSGGAKARDARGAAHSTHVPQAAHGAVLLHQAAEADDAVAHRQLLAV